METSRKLKVLTISKPYVAKAYRKKLADLASDGRFEIGLVCPLQWADQRYEGDPEAGVKTWKLPISFNGKNHFHFYLGLDEVFREFRPDIVNVEEEHYSFVTWQCFRLAAKHNAKPIFYTWQNIDKNYPPPFSWMESHVFKHSAAAVGGNSESIDILRRKGFRGKAVEIVQMGVDMERFTPPDYSDSYKRSLRKDLGLQPESFWLSFFGRIVPEKGLDILLRAVAELKKSETVDLRLLIVGAGPELSKLQELARGLNIGDCVMWKAQVASTNVPKLLQAMDVLCLPSLTRPNWKEQYGRILAEAMASGTVTVGSSSGEIPKVIGGVGMVAAEGDPNAWAGAIRKLLREPTYWKELQNLGLQRVNERYSDKVVAEKFGSLFADVASAESSIVR